MIKITLEKRSKRRLRSIKDLHNLTWIQLKFLNVIVKVNSVQNVSMNFTERERKMVVGKCHLEVMTVLQGPSTNKN